MFQEITYPTTRFVPTNEVLHTVYVIAIPIVCIHIGVALWKNKLTTTQKVIITSLLFTFTWDIFKPFIYEKLDRQTVEIPKSNTRYNYSPNSPYYQG
jgi:hypothetical protein